MKHAICVSVVGPRDCRFPWAVATEFAHGDKNQYSPCGRPCLGETPKSLAEILEQIESWALNAALR